jgi:hypothetical protein
VPADVARIRTFTHKAVSSYRVSVPRLRAEPLAPALRARPLAPWRRVGATLRSVRPLPTAPLAAGSLIAGYGVVAATGSRPLGGVVLAAGGLCCIEIWRRRHGTRTAAQLGATGFAAFVVSHLLALALGPWPAVLVVATATAVAAWALADSRLRKAPEAIA